MHFLWESEPNCVNSCVAILHAVLLAAVVHWNVNLSLWTENPTFYSFVDLKTSLNLLRKILIGECSVTPVTEAGSSYERIWPRSDWSVEITWVFASSHRPPGNTGRWRVAGRPPWLEAELRKPSECRTMALGTFESPRRWSLPRSAVVNDGIDPTDVLFVGSDSWLLTYPLDPRAWCLDSKAKFWLHSMSLASFRNTEPPCSVCNAQFRAMRLRVMHL